MGRALLILTAFVVTLLTGCGISTDEGASTADGKAGRQHKELRASTFELRGLHVLVRRRSVDDDGDMEALIEGTLTSTGSCVGIKGQGWFHPVAWPPGTGVEDGHILLPGGTALGLDDEISLGGGYLMGPLADLPPVPADCLGPTGEIAVVNDE